MGCRWKKIEIVGGPAQAAAADVSNMVRTGTCCVIQTRSAVAARSLGAQASCRSAQGRAGLQAGMPALPGRMASVVEPAIRKPDQFINRIAGVSA